MTFQGENFFVGLVALALLPVVGWRIWRGIRYGQLPVYKTRVDRDVGAAKFNTLLALHILVFLLIAVIAVDLLFGLGLKERLL
ncbi:MAG TPA: hypothetical protein VEC11_00950 [Allosphingosinicella sp.]|nr:hypothetical protein [Allosphingosinicella sp.]